MKTTDVFHVSLPLDESAFSEWKEEIHTLLVMAEAYRWGNEDIEPNATMARAYYRAAARLGDGEAMLLLAEMLAEIGAHAEALLWSKKAARVAAGALAHTSS